MATNKTPKFATDSHRKNGQSENRFDLHVNFKRVEKMEADEDGFIYIEGYASTDDIDRHGDIIPPEVWNRNALKNFKKNPVILFNHNYNRIIGKVTDLTVDDKGLYVKCAIDAADEAGRKIAMGLLKTFSIGFYLLDFDYSPEKEAWIIKKLELLEISVVTIPANQDAVFSLAKQLGGDEKLKDLRNKLLNKSVKTMANEKTSLWDKVFGKDETAEGAEQKLKKVASEKKQLEEDKKSLEAEKADLVAKNEALKNAKGDLETELNELKGKDLGTANETLKSEKVALETEKADLETKVKDLEAKAKTAVETEKSLKSEIETLKADIAKSKGLKTKTKGGSDPATREKKERKYKGNDAAANANLEALKNRH